MPVEGSQAIQGVRVVIQQQAHEIERQHANFADECQLHVGPLARDAVERLHEQVHTLVRRDSADEQQARRAPASRSRAARLRLRRWKARDIASISDRVNRGGVLWKTRSRTIRYKV